MAQRIGSSPDPFLAFVERTGSEKLPPEVTDGPGCCKVGPMSNRLAKSKSLYLRQHADNPVDWFPWGEEAFAEARRRDVPVLVSIGYSSCHWCHVMAHESFEDDYIADLMNRNFVCIKIDREERPDLDQIYMEAVQMITQQGGWPLNVFCLPDGRPFFGGTYFPPEDRGMQILPWPQLLMRISDYFKSNREELVENAGNILKNIEAMAAGGEGEPWSAERILRAATTLTHHADTEHGGFSGAPKFPPSGILLFLLSLREAESVRARPGLATAIDRSTTQTLDAMGRGGLFDHIGGGFFRYCVDAAWTIPHFEKMLYDNAQLIEVFAKGWRRFREPLLAGVVEETIQWLHREMGSPAAGLAAAIDADSPEGEGHFYTWAPSLIRDQLTLPVAEAFLSAYGVTEEGNFEDGLTHLNLRAEAVGQREALAPARKKLAVFREGRTRPTTDPKRLLGWNALLARGWIEAAGAMGREEWLRSGGQLLDTLESLFGDGSGNYRAVAYDGEAEELPAFLNDLAYLAEAHLSDAAYADLWEPGRSQVAVERAKAVVERIETDFRDQEHGGYFFSTPTHGQRLPRNKEWFDNAIPSGQASLLHVLGRLAFLTGEACYREAFVDLRHRFSAYMERAPNGVAHALGACTEEAIGLARIKARSAADLSTLYRQSLELKHWRRVFHAIDPSLPHAYELCIGTRCLAPTDDATGILTALHGQID
jgi:uncharacterized protein YyaL (SSP411 family)